ncbi:MAG: hypothetical protein RMJ07_05480 [Nitrososphaerota archaeon]|nr:hypothetical protein [Candidatus Bathyarchaeota archaeon]MDW8049113.1 hypothetical protein [Nitrososphaerota archaeon]
MKLFGKKKSPNTQEMKYDIYGGCEITKEANGYKITWRSPNLTTITVSSPPTIDGDVEVKNEGNTIRVLSMECKLTLSTNEGATVARISKI